MYYTLCLGTASQATSQGRHHKHTEVGFELTIKPLLARCLDHHAMTSLKQSIF
jgi:hypothetical protein